MSWIVEARLLIIDRVGLIIKGWVGTIDLAVVRLIENILDHAFPSNE